MGGQSGNIGLGFAIPINKARQVADQLIRTGAAKHPIIWATLDMTYAGRGAKILPQPVQGRPTIRPGGPANEAGLRPGDVIVAVDEEPVSNAPEAIVAIRSKDPGQDDVP